MLRIKLGNKVKCHAFIKPSKNHYEIDNENYICDFWEAGATEGVTIEGYHSCDRYKTIQKEFTGIFVGSTIWQTKINAHYIDNSYQEYYAAHCDTPKEFAIVYYANNKKRYVPIDMVEEVEE